MTADKALTPRQERGLQRLCAQLAVETARTPAQVRAEMDEAISVGLLR